MVTIDGKTYRTIKFSIDGELCTMILVPQSEHQSNSPIYKKLNIHGVPISSHSIPLNLDDSISCSIFVNGHHYRTGNAIQESCDCMRCQNEKSA